jgi:peroxiredoxin
MQQPESHSTVFKAGLDSVPALYGIGMKNKKEIVMKLKHLLAVVLAAVLSLSGMALSQEPGQLKPGDMLPDIRLSFPNDKEYQTYLGIEGTAPETFQIPQIQADIVLIEIFSMYCPHCQREAPLVNTFFEKLQSDPQLNQQIKLIGIGVGNSDYEVSFFQKKYNTRFPLFSDPNYIIHKQIGEVRTPFFIGVKARGDDRGKIFLAHLGGIEGVDEFLSVVLKASGLKSK